MTHDNALAILVRLHTASIALNTALDAANGANDPKLTAELAEALAHVLRARIVCSAWAEATVPVVI